MAYSRAMSPRPVLIFALLMLAGCGRNESEPRPDPPADLPKSAETRPESEADRKTRQSAAIGLRRYYALIEKRDYAAAFRLRTPGRVDRERFADNFAAYESYRVLVGTPTQPVEADGFVWVQLPVMITGRFKGGKPFGSSGNVMVRRPKTSDGPWLVVADS